MSSGAWWQPSKATVGIALGSQTRSTPSTFLVDVGPSTPKLAPVPKPSSRPSASTAGYRPPSTPSLPTAPPVRMHKAPGALIANHASSGTGHSEEHQQQVIRDNRVVKGSEARAAAETPESQKLEAQTHHQRLPQVAETACSTSAKHVQDTQSPADKGPRGGAWSPLLQGRSQIRPSDVRRVYDRFMEIRAVNEPTPELSEAELGNILLLEPGAAAAIYRLLLVDGVCDVRVLLVSLTGLTQALAIDRARFAACLLDDEGIGRLPLARLRLLLHAGALSGGYQPRSSVIDARLARLGATVVTANGDVRNDDIIEAVRRDPGLMAPHSNMSSRATGSSSSSRALGGNSPSLRGPKSRPTVPRLDFSRLKASSSASVAPKVLPAQRHPSSSPPPKVTPDRHPSSSPPPVKVSPPAKGGLQTVAATPPKMMSQSRISPSPLQGPLLPQHQRREGDEEAPASNPPVLNSELRLHSLYRQLRRLLIDQKPPGFGRHRWQLGVAVLLLHLGLLLFLLDVFDGTASNHFAIMTRGSRQILAFFSLIGSLVVISNCSYLRKAPPSPESIAFGDFQKAAADTPISKDQLHYIFHQNGVLLPRV